MTEPREGETAQISVAELLARNGRRVGSGGRRRRGTSTSGVTVADLTGETPVRSRAARIAEVEEAPAADGSAESDVPEPTNFEVPRPAAGEPVTSAPDVPEPAPDVPEPAPDVPEPAPDVPEPAPDRPAEPAVPDVPEPEPATPDVPTPAPDPPATPDVPEVAQADAPASAEVSAPAPASADTAKANRAPTPPPVAEISDTAASADPGPAGQWLALLAQVTAALVAGALLFVGFERLWADLPWIALVLAILVVLGLIAVSRVLRRSDDTLSVVIAVVAGLVVTLGPLALVLSQR